jgi:site-specific recombinase XerC
MARSAPRDRAAAFPAGFADDLDAFLNFIDLERGLSKNTVLAYRRDLEQVAGYSSAGSQRLAGGVTRAG